MAVPIKKDGIHSFADYLKWADSEQYELINGVAYNMTAPIDDHQSVSTGLLFQLCAFFEGHECKLYHTPFNVILSAPNAKDEDVDTVVHPDLFIVCDRSKITKNGYRGGPDFVIEITSPSTASRDHVAKVNLYEKHGVKEYWIVHPTDKIVFIRRMGDDGKFKPTIIQEATASFKVEVMPGLEIDFDRVFKNLT